MKKLSCIFCMLFVVTGSIAAASSASVDQRLMDIIRNNASSTFPCSNSDFISARDVLIQETSTPPMLIDIRKQSAFAQFRIPQSINLPLFTLKTKSFLKKRDLILINEGFDSGMLVAEIDKLRHDGFKNIKILHGGLKSWHDNGGRLDGDFWAIQQLAYIHPKQLQTNSNAGYWKGIDISIKKSSALHNSNEGFTHIPLLKNKNRFSEQINSLFPGDTTCRPYIVLIDEQGEAYAGIQNNLRKQKHIYFLQGGLQGWRTYLQEQTVMMESAETRTKSCETCP